MERARLAFSTVRGAVFNFSRCAQYTYSVLLVVLCLCSLQLTMYLAKVVIPSLEKALPSSLVITEPDESFSQAASKALGYLHAVY
jgi:hypothetical protein